MPDDALLRLSYPRTERIRRCDEDAQVIGTARRVTVRSVNYTRKVLAGIEIALAPDPQLHDKSLLPRTEAVPE